MKCQVIAPIADHQCLFISLPLDIPVESAVQREVWDFRYAKWKELSDILEHMQWSNYLVGEIGIRCSRFLSMLDTTIRHCIPRKIIIQKQRSHPWITEEVRQAFLHQLSLFGTTGLKSLMMILFSNWKTRNNP